ncbi:uncharacterized protein LOC122522861 [Polistes fuscatus]|uniref:uncharacterized protein LOC122522861 n=1 Tax=Polistes fuscatus TaxID=30207 RepID=UPI001CA9F1FB|nr:uncharacterized protein LOC122522861 [Polistes fuscatus]
MVTIFPRRLCKEKLTAQHLSLYAANGSNIKTYSTKSITLDLGLRRPFKWTFIIAEVITAILGADFLAHYGLLIDIRHGKLIDRNTMLSIPGTATKTTIHSISTVSHDMPFAGLLLAKMARSSLSCSSVEPIAVVEASVVSRSFAVGIG